MTGLGVMIYSLYMGSYSMRQPQRGRHHNTGRASEAHERAAASPPKPKAWIDLPYPLGYPSYLTLVYGQTFTLVCGQAFILVYGQILTCVPIHDGLGTCITPMVARTRHTTVCGYFHSALTPHIPSLFSSITCKRWRCSWLRH